MSGEPKSRCPGRLFAVLWAFTVLIELVSLQVRLAIFGGTGWLTSIKFTTISEKLGFIAALAVLCASLCGLWTLIFSMIGKLLKTPPEKMARRCATSWIILIVVDLIFRHKIGELLGDAFDFFEFATGVGGVWRMLVQAFQWYGDIILLSILGVAVIAVATWAFFRWFFKPREKVHFLDRMPKVALISFIFTMLVTGFLLMSVLAPKFPATQKVLANETMFGAAVNAILNAGSDFDNDGYGAFDLPADDEPFNGDIHPHALDNPGDGIDQDLLLGDLNLDEIQNSVKKHIESQGQAVNQSFSDRRNVILVIMESVRYDMLDAKVDGKPVMPELNAFIQRGAIRVDGAFATRGFTQNSVNQTFAGSYFETDTTLVDDFKQQGYYTAVFNGESLLDEKFDESCGWNRSGDTIVDPRNIVANVDHHQSVPALMLMDEAEKFIQTYDTAQPLFLYTFFQDPHFPYQQDNPPVLNDRDIKRTEIALETRPRLWRTYANQVHHLDKAAGRLIRALDDKKMLDNSLVIFISDHGESLFDDGYLLGHGIAIQDLMTHAVMTIWGAKHDIPSMISHPDIRKFIHDDFASAPKKPEIIHNSAPILQFIGATTVPSAISHRFEDGSRITWEFSTKTAWRETSNACFNLATQRKRMPQHGDIPIDTKLDRENALKPIELFHSPIENPLETPEVKALIREWEYLQWYHRK